MKPVKSGLILLAALLIIGGTTWYLLSQKPIGSESTESSNAGNSRYPGNLRETGSAPLPETAESEEKKESGIPGLQSPPDQTVAALISSSLQAFRNAKSEEESMAILKRLREGIRSSPNEAGASAAIIAFLASGEDALTGLPFLVGPDGVMEVTPTMRTALLDLLPSLDPLASIEVARQIMDQRNSQDEYALALRNLAWNDFEGDMKLELTERFSSMLNTNEWLAKPSAGFLEAFDIAVEVGTPRTFTDVASVLRLETTEGEPVNNGTTRASLIALDRMVLRNPALLVEKFQENPDFLAFAPDHRAALMSRLDITDPAQRQTFVEYLQRPQHGPNELEYFSELFPNGNYFYGNRLVTADETTPSLGERQAQDVEALAQVENLLPTFAPGPARQSLEHIRARLENYTLPNQNPEPIPAMPREPGTTTPSAIPPEVP
jgi:hypothetical protein